MDKNPQDIHHSFDTEQYRARGYRDALVKYKELIDPDYPYSSPSRRKYINNHLYDAKKTSADLVRDVHGDASLTDEEAVALYDQAFIDSGARAMLRLGLTPAECVKEILNDPFSGMTTGQADALYASKYAPLLIASMHRQSDSVEDFVRKHTNKPGLTDEEALAIYTKTYITPGSSNPYPRHYTSNASDIFVKPPQRLNDPSLTLSETIHQLAGGAPGPQKVLMMAASTVPHVDPDNKLGGIGFLVSVDMAGIHDGNIWDLYNNTGENLVTFIAAFRANQLGILKTKDLHDMAQKKPTTIEPQNLVKKVQEILPAFAKEHDDEEGAEQQSLPAGPAPQ